MLGMLSQPSAPLMTPRYPEIREYDEMGVNDREFEYHP